MAINPYLRRLLLGCVLSNVVIGAVGLTTVGQTTTTAAFENHCAASTTCSVPKRARVVTVPTTDAAAPTTIAPVLTTTASPTKTSSAPRVATRTSTTPAAVAVDDVTGIASSTAPQTPVRIAPTTGTYPVTFSGSASVDGKAQSVPTSGTVRLAKSGSNIEQSSPNAPGDAVLVQRYGANESALVSLQMTANNTTKTFVPASPVTYLQFNSPQGTSWNWTATSTDGKTHVQANGTVGGVRAMVINGETVPTVELVTTLTLSGDITGIAELITWASPSYRLPVMQRQVINATAKVSWFYSAKLVSDVTTTFTRLSPN